ncbi:outer membrane beta-barrel protein [Flavobacterium procerum]|uniref:Outer membrane beta-barrel protein n=1 Tax=Flavobacterium procerum TaxID=1455569 RepID=A0ABV6BTR2_9FLAO
MTKKKIALLTFAFFAILNVAQSQVTFKPGVRAGLSLSTIGFHGDFKPDFYVGALGEINLTKRYTLQPEINYSRQGANNLETTEYYYDGGNYLGRTGYRDLSIDYLSVGIINKFNFKTGFQVQFGPTLDFIVKNNLPYSDSDVDFGFMTGLGYKLPSGITIEGRFKANILDNFGSYNDGFYFEENNYSPSFAFQIGVSYVFGKK